MSVTVHTGHSITRRERLPGSLIGLCLLLTLLFVGAFQGGLAMVTEPLEPLGMSAALLERSPVETFRWPGVFLLGIAAASLLALLGLLLGWSWRWAGRFEQIVGYRWPWMTAVATGVILLAFEILELFMIPFHPVMHPILLTGSCSIIALAFTPTARRHLGVGPQAR